MVMRAIRWIGKQLATLNWFESDLNDIETVRRERLSTRVYLCLIIIICIALIIYTGLKIRTNTVIVDYPSYIQFENLLEHYNRTLQCSCSKIAISYETFAQIEVKFHPVCSSSFISFEWIQKVYAANITHIWPMDVRTILSTFWQLVSAFCQNLYEAVTKSILDYKVSTLFSPQVMSSIEVETRAEASRDFALTSTQTAIARNLLAIRRMISDNQLVSGLATNAHLQTYFVQRRNQFYAPPIMNIYDDCSCIKIDGCPKVSGLYEYDMWDTKGIYNKLNISKNIPGIMFDCYPLNAVLASTFECYYTSDCLKLIHPMFNVTPLSSISSTQFNMNSTIQTLVDKVFIDEMTVQTSFASYYTNCNPSICTYIYSRRFDKVFMFTSVVGIMGGLTVILKLLAPLIVRGTLALNQRRRRTTLPTVEVIHTNPRTCVQTFILLVRSIPNRILDQWLKLNIFDTYSRDENVIYRQQITSRVYLICLLISIIGLSVYTLFSVQIKSISIPSPSQDTFNNLYEKYSDSLRCECSQLSISYSDFIQITPTMHQICSSDCISPIWYNRFFEQNITFLYISSSADFIWPLYFPMLQSFCFLVNRTITDSIRVLKTTSFINNEILPQWQFDEQAQRLIDTFTNETVSEFTRMFALIRNATAASQFVTVPSSNAQFIVKSDGQMTMHISNLLILEFDDPTHATKSCSCNGDTSNCVFVQRIYDNTSASFYYLKGLYVGCLLMDGIMFSTFECWFDLICFNKIRQWSLETINTNMFNITPLNINLPSRFSPRTPINQLMNELFLENWNINISYENFYSGCAPNSCDYTEEERYDIFYTILTIIAIYGGLSKGLKIVVPWFVRLALICLRRKCYRTNYQQNSLTIVQTIPVYKRFWLKISSLNWFYTRSSTIDTLHRECLYTKIYLILFSISILIIIISTSLTKRSYSKTIMNPSIQDYERLEVLYSDTLRCPCSKISINHRLFITQIKATLHPVCLSDYVKGRSEWIYWLSGRNYDIEWVHLADFRRWGSGFFIWIASFCTLANITINSAITNFQSSSLLINQPMTRSQFESQINLQIDRFLDDTRNNFVQTLKFYQDMIQGNNLMSFYATNWMPVAKQPYDVNGITVFTEPILYNSSCSCAITRTCMEAAGIYASDGTLLYVVDGVQHGCSLIESYLASSLSCFYSNSCLVSLFAATALGDPNGANSTPWNSVFFGPRFAPLNSSSIQHFSINDTFSTIVNDLFVDAWLTNISYESFFTACAVRYCTYSIIQRFDFLYVLTTFLSLFTGISLIIRIIIPRIGIIVTLLKNRIRIKPQLS
ncbi:hypothetical protein I4U23_011485 [Adineta vaga]|nr:hypothetical protein I4U23_011485 [Adineta vaga]